jgi:hypothetical protein
MGGVLPQTNVAGPGEDVHQALDMLSADALLAGDPGNAPEPIVREGLENGSLTGIHPEIPIRGIRHPSEAIEEAANFHDHGVQLGGRGRRIRTLQIRALIRH